LKRNKPYQLNDTNLEGLDESWQQELGDLSASDKVLAKQLGNKALIRVREKHPSVLAFPQAIYLGLVGCGLIIAAIFLFADDDVFVGFSNHPADTTTDNGAYTITPLSSDNAALLVQPEVGHQQEDAVTPVTAQVEHVTTPTNLKELRPVVAQENSNAEAQPETPSDQPVEKKREKRKIPEMTGAKKEITGVKLSSGSDKAAAKALTGFIRAEEALVVMKENLYVYESRKENANTLAGLQYAASDMPAYPGGDDELTLQLAYLIGSLNLTADETLQRTSVILELVVNAKGEVERTTILSPVPNSVKNRITEAVSKLGHWQAGKKSGKKGSIIYQVSVQFAGK
jgi:hypothetical protein